jgi:FkbM family methyltransferase
LRTPSRPVIDRLKRDPRTASLARSLDYYYGDPDREAALDAFYSSFVSPGDLVFDIGAHVGDRVATFRRLGARVVAVEPQPACARVLRTIHAGCEEVAVIEAACAAHERGVTLYVNSANPTVSTASREFVRAAGDAPGWEGQTWESAVPARSVTLDTLLARYGEPAFTKIDVEGFEDVVLAGLSRPLPALSFEFTTIRRATAYRCLDRLTELGFAGFDVSTGESLEMAFGRWRSAARIAEHLAALPHSANAGDVYCVTRADRPPAGQEPVTAP